MTRYVTRGDRPNSPAHASMKKKIAIYANFQGDRFSVLWQRRRRDAHRCSGEVVMVMQRLWSRREVNVRRRFRGTGWVRRESGCGCRGSVLAAAASKVRLVPPSHPLETHRALLAHTCTPIGGVLRHRRRSRRSRYSRVPPPPITPTALYAGQTQGPRRPAYTGAVTGAAGAGV